MSRAPELATLLEQPPHRLLGQAGLEVDLEAVLTGVPRSRDQSGLAEDASPLEGVIRQVGHALRRDAVHERARPGPLNRQKRDLVGLVRHGHVAPGAGGGPGEVLRRIAGVHDEHVGVGAAAVDEQVVHERALLRQERRVVRAPVGELADVVGSHALKVSRRAASRHLELAHVRDVEDPDALAHGLVLLEDAGVLDGHLPAAEIDQLRAELAVQVIEGRPLRGDG